MNFRRKRVRIYAVVIAVGLCVLIADRIFGTGGAPAPAAAEVPAVEAWAPEMKQILSLTRLPFPGAPLVALDGAARDPFAMTDAAKGRLLRPPEPPAAAAAPGAAATESIPHLSARRLSAVMLLGDTHVAIVDDLRLVEGQELDGCVLQQVTERSVKFSCGGQPIELQIESALDSGGNR